VRNPFAGAARGRQYYMAFNCAGCHGGRGGGGIGPPFLVRDFIYGSDPGNIFQSIVQGRPHGMPAYGGKAPDEVIWKIVAYVQSLAEPYLRDAPERDERGRRQRPRARRRRAVMQSMLNAAGCRCRAHRRAVVVLLASAHRVRAGHRLHAYALTVRGDVTEKASDQGGSSRGARVQR
jgi:hypothetical protein